MGAGAVKIPSTYDGLYVEWRTYYSADYYKKGTVKVPR